MVLSRHWWSLWPSFGLAGPTAAGAATVDAGALRAVTGSSPWDLRFTDAKGRSVLAQNRGTGAGPTGTIGFEAGGSWRHATRAVSVRRAGRALVAVLATTDPGGRRLGVRLTRDAAGVIRLRAEVIGSRAGVTALGVAFGARRGERFLGFGERSNAVDQRGKVVENYVGEGAYPEADRPIAGAVVPPWGFQRRDDATYFPIPWLLSTRGYGVLVDNTETSYFRLGTESPGAWSVEVRAAPPNQPQGAGAPAPSALSLRVFAGPTPAAALRRFTAATGRQPAPEAPWYFGPWVQPSGEESAQVAKLRGADAPVSVAQTYLHYLPCGDQQGRRPQERARTRALHAAGMAVTTYFNPMICTGYQPPYGQAVAQNALTKTASGAPYLYRYSTDESFDVAQFDFSTAAGRRLFGGLLGEAVQDGFDGWMEDFGEYTPLDSRSANGMTGTAMHNLYPVQYHCAAQAFARRTRRPLGRFIRSGFTGVAPCAQIVWGGDPTVGWGFDGLESAVTNGVTMGLSGISTWGSDIGGFFAFGANSLSPELLKRWVQFGAVSGVMRTQANGIDLPRKPRPQVWDDGQLPALAPLREAAHAALPVPRGRRRHLSTHRPADHAPPARWCIPRQRRAARRDDQFLFGPDLLAAPVVKPGARSAVGLPAARPLGGPMALRRIRSARRRARARARANAARRPHREPARAARRAAAAGARGRGAAAAAAGRGHAGRLRIGGRVW